MQGYEIEQLLTRELGGGEKLLWSGRPRQGLMLRPSDGLFIPFSLMWGGFAVFWEASAIKTGAPFFFMLWGIPFVAVGLYITVGRFFVDARIRERTAYGVTNERIVIVSGLFKSTTKSLSLRTLSDISLNERGDGSGTITFGPSGNSSLFVTGRGGRQLTPAFEGIANARSVHQAIRDAQKSAA
jgi:hypothetical protein